MGLPAIGIAAVAVSAAGTLIKAYGDMAGGKAAEEMGKRNAELARAAARDALRRGEGAESRHRIKVGQMIGQQRAIIGGSGVVVGEGSTQAVVEDTRAMGELDALIIRNNAAREAWGYNAQATNFEYQGEALKKQAQFSMFSSILTGAGSAIGMGYNMGAFQGKGSTNA